MALYGNSPFNSRELKDGYFSASVAVPGVTTAFDLFQATPYSVTEVINAFVATTVTTTTGTASIALQDSADNVTFANIPEVATGLVANYTGSSTDVVKLPPTTRRYLRISGSNVGAVTANAALSLKF